MGVTGLWKLVEASGKPVPLETLENKVLAIDISIWLHQVVKGYQDNKGGHLPNAHILGLFNRICKLLYFRIKPVFVFDGGAPQLKLQTIAKRAQGKSKIQSEAERIEQLLLETLAKEKIVKQALGDPEKLAISPVKIKLNKIEERDDIFHLPPMLENALKAEIKEEEDEGNCPKRSYDFNINQIDVTSSHFKSLPADIRHDILTDIKETRKQSSWARLRELAAESDDFSTYQMTRLLRRRNVQVELEQAEKEMGGKTWTLDELESLLSEDGVLEASDKRGQKIASNEHARFLLVRDITKAINEAKVKPEEPQPSTSKNSAPIDTLNDDDDEDLQRAIQMSLTHEPDPEPTDGKIKLNPVQRQKLGDTIQAHGLVRGFMMEYAEMNDYDIQDLMESTQIGEERQEEHPLKAKFPNTDDYVLFGTPKKSQQVETVEIMSDSDDEKIATPNKSIEIVVQPGKFEPEDDFFADVFQKTEESEVKNDFPEVPDVEVASISSDDTVEYDLEEYEAESGFVSEESKVVEKFVEKEEKNEEEDAEEASENDKFWSVLSEPVKVVVTREKSRETEVEINEEKIHELGDTEKNVENHENSEKEQKVDEMSFDQKITDNESSRDTSSPEKLNSDQLQASTTKTTSSAPESTKTAGTSSALTTSSDFIPPESNIMPSSPVISPLITKPPSPHQNSPEISKSPPSPPQQGSPTPTNILQLSENEKFWSDVVEVTPKKPEAHKTPVKTPNRESSPPPGKVASPFFVNRKTPSSKKKIPDSPQPSTSKTVSKSLFNDPQTAIQEAADELRNQKTSQELSDMKNELRDQQRNLAQEKNKLDRMGTSITESMSRDCKQLLKLFGIPYVESPMEAEAQCAFLNMVSLTDGTISDDSDIWLFGGQTVYKNFFVQKKIVMEFRHENINEMFHLDRKKLIQLAMLVGSDYTVGLTGVGAVTALEILAAFPPTPETEGLTDQYQSLVSSLRKFREWFVGGKQPGPGGRTVLKSKLKNVELIEGFPNLNIARAYLEPIVDTDTEPFTWGSPDQESLVEYAKTKLGWTRMKTEEILGPVMKRLNEKKQATIKDYFKSQLTKKFFDSNKMSKRVQKAVDKMGGAEDEETEEKPKKAQKRKAPAKKKKKEDENEAKQHVEAGNVLVLSDDDDDEPQEKKASPEKDLEEEEEKPAPVKPKATKVSKKSVSETKKPKAPKKPADDEEKLFKPAKKPKAPARKRATKDEPSTSGEPPVKRPPRIPETKQVIPQREKDKLESELAKQRAIEVFKKNKMAAGKK